MSFELIPKLKAILETTGESVTDAMVASSLADEIADIGDLHAFLDKYGDRVERSAQSLLLKLVRARQDMLDASELLKRLESDAEFRKAFVADPLGVLRSSVSGLTLPLEEFVAAQPTEMGCSAAKKSIVVADHVEVGCSAAKKSVMTPSSVDLGCSAAKKSVAAADHTDLGCTAAKKSVVARTVELGCSAAKKSVTTPAELGCSAAKKSVTTPAELGCSAAKKSSPTRDE